MPKIPHFGNTQAHKTTNACPQKVTNTLLESSYHVGEHPILICLIQGYLVGIIGPTSAKYPVYRVCLNSTTTLFWKASSMFIWGPRHEPLNAVSDVKIQLKVIKILGDSRLDSTHLCLWTKVPLLPGKCSKFLTGFELTNWDTTRLFHTSRYNQYLIYIHNTAWNVRSMLRSLSYNPFCTYGKDHRRLDQTCGSGRRW